MSEIKWEPVPSERQLFEHDVAAERDADSYPGMTVRYGQCRDGYWRVEIVMDMDGVSRFSDAFATDNLARSGAEALVSALRIMWPDPPISYGRKVPRG